MPQDSKYINEEDRNLTIAGLTPIARAGKHHARPSYHEILAVGVTLLIVLAGYVLGMETRPYNFARSGTLIVITGIIFAALDLNGRLDLVDEWVASRLEKIRPGVMLGWDKQGQAKATEKIENRAILEENVTSGVKLATDKARMRLRFIEVAILILGTLIHGYGDLAVVGWKF